ncbi:MAG: outer membrane lipoprotein carrier protein LolA [Balneolaceae bacterium]
MGLRIFNKKAPLLLFLGILISIQHVQAQSSAFIELKTRFDESSVFHAEFEHTYIDAYTEESTNSEGLIWIDQKGYKLESDDKIIVVDGEISRVYEGSRNRLIISEYDPEEDDFAPSKMLSGIDETYTTSEKKLSNGNTLITLLTEDDFATFVKVEIEVNKMIEPLKITAYDFADNLIITTFENGKFERLTDQTFNLDYPEDAEIVDMRF